MDELEGLLDAYWNLAFDEGKRNRSNGTKANEVLHKIREAWNRRASLASAPDGSFNMWWDSDRVQPDNPYQKGSPVYWALEGWCAALAPTTPVSEGKDKIIASLKARIDELMLEYCPDETTTEQLEEYEKHQVPLSEDQKDAARWRFFYSIACSTDFNEHFDSLPISPTKAQLDAAIDAAMQEGKP